VCVGTRLRDPWRDKLNRLRRIAAVSAPLPSNVSVGFVGDRAVFRWGEIFFRFQKVRGTEHRFLDVHKTPPSDDVRWHDLSDNLSPDMTATLRSFAALAATFVGHWYDSLQIMLPPNTFHAVVGDPKEMLNYGAILKRGTSLDDNDPTKRMCAIVIEQNEPSPHAFAIVRIQGGQAYEVNNVNQFGGGVAMKVVTDWASLGRRPIYRLILLFRNT
jgi:hypothetical protein